MTDKNKKDRNLRSPRKHSVTMEFTDGHKVSFGGRVDRVTSLADGGITYVADFDKADAVDFSTLPFGYIVDSYNKLSRACLAQLRQCVIAFPHGVEAGDVICKGYRDILIDHGMLERIDGHAYATPYGAKCAVANEGVYDGDKNYLDRNKVHPEVEEIDNFIIEMLSQKSVATTHYLKEDLEAYEEAMTAVRLLKQMIINRFLKLVR